MYCKFSLELWEEMLTDFINDKSTDKSQQWVVMGNSIGGLLTLMLTESLQEGHKVSAVLGCDLLDSSNMREG